MSGSRKRILILGGGSSQIHLIRRARMAGYIVALADRDPAAPGRVFADQFTQVSTTDADGITEAAGRLGVTAIVTAGTDQPVLAAAAASARLNLPYPISVATSIAVTNKREMKARFVAGSVANADHAFLPKDVSEREAARLLSEISPPFVVKPLDSQGQRGVVRAPDITSAIRHIPDALYFSRAGEVLVERYYESDEVTVSGWVCGGVTHIFSVTDRVTLENPPSLGVCVAHRHPSQHIEEHGRAIRLLTERVVDACGITSGPIYFQLLIGADGIIVNEAACRLGGAYEDEVLPLSLGFDTVGYLLRSAAEPGSECAEVARSVAALADKRQAAVNRAIGTGAGPESFRSFFVVPLLFARPGTVDSLTGDEAARTIPGVSHTHFLLPVGTEIRPMRNSTQRIGYAVVTGTSPEGVNQSVRRLFETIGVKDAAGVDLLMDTSRHCMIP